MSKRAALVDLRQQISELGDRFPRLSDDNLFVLWYASAMLVEDERTAAESVVGGSGDKSVDGIYIDEHIQCAFIVQAKFHQKVKAAAESRSDVIAFAGLADVLCGPIEIFNRYKSKCDPLVSERLKEVRERIQKRRYTLQLHYVTLGKCSAALRNEAEGIVKTDSGRRGELRLFDGEHVLDILTDYLDGVAPPIPSLDLPFEGNGAINRFDSQTGIDSWVFTMRGRDVGQLYGRSGIRLFARNVRGFLQDTEINVAMQATLATEPQYFWYFNNGVTIVCDKVKKVTEKGREILQVHNPQVINGQQTTRVLDEAAKSPAASVLVRVIQIPRASKDGDSQFDMLVSRIVKATNWQNAIKPSDLMSNDRQQVAIEREFRKVGYHYLRKRQPKAEAKKAAKSQYRFQVPKEELAQAVGACLLDSYTVRRGKEHLFEEENYTVIFPNYDAEFYLGKFWLLKKITDVSRGYPERGYAKWVVMHFAWSQLERLIDGRPLAFRRACEKQPKNQALIVPLERALSAVYVAALQFYRKERGTGPQALDISTFFNRRGLDEAFAKHWESPDNKRRNTFESAVSKVEAALKEVTLR
jgi:AIPR protein